MILDASAILAVLFEEPGRDLVIAEMEAGAIVCSVNLAEVATILIRDGMARDVVAGTIADLPMVVSDADVELSLLAAALYPDTKRFGLSLGDRYCLALALREKLSVVTADRIWKNVGPIVGIDVRTIR